MDKKVMGKGGQNKVMGGSFLPKSYCGTVSDQKRCGGGGLFQKVLRGRDGPNSKV